MRNFSKKERIEAVIVYTENSRAADVTEAAAERGLHVMVEKPIAANLEQAQQMYRAAERSGIRLRVNYPTTWNPVIRYAGEMAQDGPKQKGCTVEEAREWYLSLPVEEQHDKGQPMTAKDFRFPVDSPKKDPRGSLNISEKLL